MLSEKPDRVSRIAASLDKPEIAMLLWLAENNGKDPVGAPIVVVGLVEKHLILIEDGAASLTMLGGEVADYLRQTGNSE